MAMAWTMVSTNLGTKHLIKNYLITDNLHLDSDLIHGNIVDGLRIDALRYHTTLGDVYITDLHFIWPHHSLIWGLLHHSGRVKIKTLSLDIAHVGRRQLKSIVLDIDQFKSDGLIQLIFTDVASNMRFKVSYFPQQQGKIIIMANRHDQEHRLVGRFNHGHLSLKHDGMAMLGGKIDINIKGDFESKPSLRADINVQHIDFSHLMILVNTDISFKGYIQWTPEQLLVNFNQLLGMWLGSHIDGYLYGDLTTGHFKVKSQVHVADSSLNINIDNRSNTLDTVDMIITQLNSILPRSDGHMYLHAQGKKRRGYQLSFDAENIILDAIFMHRALLRAKIKPIIGNIGNIKGDITAQINTAKLLNHHIDQGNFHIQGQLSGHRLSWKIKRKQSQIKGLISGIWKDHRWQGLWTAFQARGSTVSFKSPVRLTWQPQGVTFSKACWQDEGKRHFCIEGDYQDDQWHVSGSAQDWPLRYLLHPFADQLHVDVINGVINGQWFIGSQGVPQRTFTGDVRISDMRLNIPDLHMSADQGQGRLTGDGSKSKINLGIRLGRGHMKIHGQGDLNTQAMSLILDGKAIKLIGKSSFHMVASPHLKAHLQKGLLSIEGDVHIDQGYYRHTKHHDLVKVSSDVIYHRGDQHTGDLIQAIDGKIDLQLSDAVEFKINQLSGKLTGQLGLKLKGFNQINANGQLVIKKGLFDMGINKIDLYRGFIGYYGGNIANPYFDFSVGRQIKVDDPIVNALDRKLRVEMQVKGSVDKQKVRYTSSPISLSDQDILSYLLTGYPMGTGDQANSILSNQASSIKLGANILQMFSVAKQLKKAFSLDELSFEDSSKDVDIGGVGTALVVAKNLSRSLSLKYLKNLEDDHFAIMLRYHLNPYLQLRGLSNQLSNSLMFFYAHER